MGKLDSVIARLNGKNEEPLGLVLQDGEENTQLLDTLGDMQDLLLHPDDPDIGIKLETLINRVTQLITRQDSLETKLNQRLSAVLTRLDEIEEDLEQLPKSLPKAEERPRKWTFDIQRNAHGQMTSVDAKAQA
jgi:hypothetical protein